jgi:tetratricopeptide (TPR) repeat protein
MIFTGKNKFRSGRQIYKLNKIRTFAAVFFLILSATITILVVSRVRSGINNTTKEILRVWNEGEFETAYEISKNALYERPVDYFLLTMKGFSAYQAGISQINSFNTLFYIDESIRALRKSLLLKESNKDGRVYYVLGKAYSYKGKEYSELSIKYLEKAKSLSYNAQDIPEYLGLAYAASGDFRSSVEAFSQAFVAGQAPSDNLLLSIARSYLAMDDFTMALGYLQQCINTSADSKSVNIARLLLGELYVKLGDLEKAEAQYTTVLEEAGDNAEVRYQLGELYLLKGDTTGARAEWRRAYRLDPAHARVRARLNI